MNGSTRTRRGLRRVLGLSLGSAMIMAMAPGVAAAQATPDARDTEDICGDTDSSFSDVSSANTHAYNIECMADYELTEGLTGGDRYGPALGVTRAQMASFIARFVEDATGETLPAGDPNRFDDSDEFVSPHGRNINKLAAAEIVKGTGDGDTYSPGLIVNRQQMASFIRNAVSYIHNGVVDDNSAPPENEDAEYFDDQPFVTAHHHNILALAGVGIVQGRTSGNYDPVDPVLRDQMASFVMRAYDYVESGEMPTEPVDPEPEPDGPTIDTAFVSVDADTPGVASEGDVWDLGFNDDIDTYVTSVDGVDTGVTVTVTDGDDTFTVQCLVDPDDVATGVDEDNVAAACDIDEDADLLSLTLLDDPVVGDNANIDYPLTITGTTVVTEDGSEIDFDAEDAALTLDVDSAT